MVTIFGTNNAILPATPPAHFSTLPASSGSTCHVTHTLYDVIFTIQLKHSILGEHVTVQACPRLSWGETECYICHKNLTKCYSSSDYFKWSIVLYTYSYINKFFDDINHIIVTCTTTADCKIILSLTCCPPNLYSIV